MSRYDYNDIYVEEAARSSRLSASHLEASRSSLPAASLPSEELAQKKKQPVLQPGTPCGPFEELLSTTKTVQNGVTSYLVCKALSGPILRFATQNPPPSLPPSTRKTLPEIPAPLQSSLEPHLPCYSAITHQGMYRNYNQDKITIVMQEDIKWFGVYDGHGGDKCAQFLKDNLHSYFFKNKYHRKDTKLALKEAFHSAEKEWLSVGDKSGSCCIVVVAYQDTCYVANLGDSRAILASEGGRKVYQITKDHKPSNPSEQARVISAGGKIYQTTAFSEIGGKTQVFVGPLRVFPGRLSITRTFGDIQAKDQQIGGNSKVVICDPQINSFDMTQHNFIVIGSDGLWDRIDNKDALKTVTRECLQREKLQEQLSTNVPLNNLTNALSADIATTLLKQAMSRGSTDNISVIVVGLPSFSELLRPQLMVVQKGTSEHIKVLTSINSPSVMNVSQVDMGKNKKKKEDNSDKENFPDKVKGVDSRIEEINKNAARLSSIYPR